MYGNIPVYGRHTVNEREVFSVDYPYSNEFPKPSVLLTHDKDGLPVYTFLLDVDFVEQYALDYKA